MCSLNHTSDTRKRLGYVNTNPINQLELNPQIHDNNQKVKGMTKKKRVKAQRQLTTEKRNLA
jgi:hypothetical protein